MTDYKFSLKEIAKERGLNANRVALLAGMSRQAVTLLMRDDVKQVQIQTVGKLCAGLGVTPADLFTVSEVV